jgi:hypothetical protein
MNKNKIGFSSDDTKIIKGVAIILMLMHHLWAFPDRLSSELKYVFNIFGNSSIYYLGMFGKICVSLFFFLGGYGLCLSSKKRDFNIFNNIKKLYLKYWKVFLIFVPIGFIFFKNQTPYCQDEAIYSIFNNFQWNTIIGNFLGFNSNLNREWWFFGCYLYAILTFPFLSTLFKKFNTQTKFFLLFLLTILVTNVLPALGKIEVLGYLNTNPIYSIFFCQTAPFISCFWAGIIFAEDDLLVNLKTKLEDCIKINPIYDLIGIAFVIFIRQNLFGATFDILLVPFFIIFLWDFIERFKILEKILKSLGNNSTNMWLIHSFYCYYFGIISKFIVSIKWALPSLLFLIIITYISSLIIDFFWKKIDNLILFTKSKFAHN